MSISLSEAFKEMLIIDYCAPETTLGPLTLRVTQDRREIKMFAKFLVEFANHFCHYWSAMDTDERVSFCRDLEQCVPTDYPMPIDGETRMDPSDFGTMLYYIHTNYRERSYTSVIPALVAETPLMGSESLIRKLSVDYHAIIPILFNHAEGLELRQSIKALAIKHDVSIHVPTDKPLLRADWDTFVS